MCITSNKHTAGDRILKPVHRLSAQIGIDFGHLNTLFNFLPVMSLKCHAEQDNSSAEQDNSNAEQQWLKCVVLIDCHKGDEFDRLD